MYYERPQKGLKAMAPTSEPSRLSVSVLVCAYNEERNIGRLLDALHSVETDRTFQILEVLVVASGCTDGTVPLVQERQKVDPRIRVIVQPERRGKAAAMKTGLEAVQGDVVLVENADTLPAPGAIANVLRPFQNPRVGLVCTHPVPMNREKSVTSHLSCLLWDVHDEISRLTPKSGEAFAFRRIAIPLTEDIEDDDTFLGMYIGSRSVESVYARDAVIYNRAPTNPQDLLRQRLRINRQILGLRGRSGFTTSTWTPRHMAAAVGRYLTKHPSEIGWVLAMAVLEGMVRVGAVISNATSAQPLKVWTPVESTKGGIRVPTRPGGMS